MILNMTGKFYIIIGRLLSALSLVSGSFDTTPVPCDRARDISFPTIGANFHRTILASPPGRIAPHRAPPYEELDLRREFAHLFSGKLIKNTAAIKTALSDSSMRQIVLAYSAFPGPLAGFKGPYF